MHGTYIKVLEGEQARMYNIYTNMKLKLLKVGELMVYKIVLIYMLCICWSGK